jgi:exo-1,4-beta-D-glucosaminidase
MLNNAWPSMIWHLIDYSLDAGGGYYGVKKACEPLHIQYAYDDRSIVVVNSTYQRATGLHASVVVRGIAWNEVYRNTAAVDAASDSTQRVFTIPEEIYASPERVFFIDLTLNDAAGQIVSHNFYWVPTTLTTFDWPKTRNTYTPALRYEDLTALAHLPQATVSAQAELAVTPRGRQLQLHLNNTSSALVFQLHAAVRTKAGDLVAPVLWNDNWIQLTPGESTTLTALLPENSEQLPVVQIEGWNIPTATIVPKPPRTEH